MTDRDFEAMLREDLSELPPAPQLAQTINPWRKAVTRVLWGLALNAITLNFAKLQYILPSIGMILLLLGFQALRRENKGFKACWVLTIFLAVIRLFTLSLSATIWLETLSQSLLIKLLNYGIFLLQLALMVCLRFGLKGVQQKAGLAPNTKAATALVIWYFLILPLSLIAYTGWVIGLLMVVGYILVIRSLWKLSKILDEAGYAIHAAPVRISDRWFTVLCCGVLALCIAAGLLFFRQYPMEWMPAPQTTQEEAIADLSELAIPEHVLRDLTDEDLAACMGTPRMAIHEEEREFDNGDILLITHIALELPGEGMTWKYIHHFRWAAPPSCYGTESIQLWTTYNSIEGWHGDGTFTGRVLYDKDGQTFAAPYYSLDTVSFTTDTIWGKQQATDPIATFSFPKGGENYRCYIAYDATLIEYGWLTDSFANYTHQLSLLQYPVQTAARYVTRRSIFSEDTIFEYDQSQLLFYPLEDGTIQAIGCKWRSRTYEPTWPDVTWYWADKIPQAPEETAG